MRKRGKILVVDDDRELLYALGLRLGADGYQVTLMQDAAMVIGAAVRGEPDLIILDIGLPDADGLTVLTRLQAIVATASIPVIILTARSLAYARKAFENGAVAFMEKPVENRELMAAIEAALQTQRTAPWQARKSQSTSRRKLARSRL
jgi:two-component system, OmpR family, KDP operon response regulator KdpE